MSIHIDIFMHCALYVFYEANKDDYYNKLFGELRLENMAKIRKTNTNT